MNSEGIDENEELIVLAEKLIDHFLEMCIEFYGAPFITHVVHILRHLPRDCARFGIAIAFSCFEFENFNHELSSSAASGNNPVEQIINRYNENVF